MELGFTDIRTEKFSFTAEMQELKGFLGMFTFVVPIVSSASGWTDAQQKEWTPRVLQEAEKVIVERHGDGVISFPFTTLTTVATKPLE